MSRTDSEAQLQPSDLCHDTIQHKPHKGSAPGFRILRLHAGIVSAGCNFLWRNLRNWEGDPMPSELDALLVRELVRDKAAGIPPDEAEKRIESDREKARAIIEEKWTPKTS